MTRAEELALVAKHAAYASERAEAVDRLVADAEALAEALEAIKQNAEAWHGQPGIGHLRALTVIAKTAENALAHYRGEK